MLEKRLHLYFKKNLLHDRWFYGDRYLRQILSLILKKKKTNSLELVFLNLCKGLKQIGVKYDVNLPFNQIKENDQVVVLGSGKQVLKGYDKSNKIVAGIGLMTHPANWPNIFQNYPIAVYLQHSKWTTAIYNKWFGEGACKIWPAGIDTEQWKPTNELKTELLIYVKFLWDKEINKIKILTPLITFLTKEKIPHQVIEYGFYTYQTYRDLLKKSCGMIFLCEHESQGLAYQEALAMNVPILAWEQGLWLDPNRIEWGEQEMVNASSVPYFDEHCGDKFKDLDEFEQKFHLFYSKAKNNSYAPRNYILENLSLAKSAERMVEILKETYS